MIDAFRPLARDRARRAREIVAIASSKHVDISQMTVKEILEGRPRSAANVKRALAGLTLGLQKAIETKGDRRIPDSGLVARSFMEEIEKKGNDIIRSGGHPILEHFLAQGIDLNTLPTHTKMEVLLDLSEHYGKLNVVLDATGFGIAKARSVDRARLPSCLVIEGMRLGIPETAERKGSELNDLYISALAPYVDYCFVDKRMFEARKNLRNKKVPESFLSSIVRVPKDAAWMTTLISDEFTGIGPGNWQSACPSR